MFLFEKSSVCNYFTGEKWVRWLHLIKVQFWLFGYWAVPSWFYVCSHQPFTCTVNSISCHFKLLMLQALYCNNMYLLHHYASATIHHLTPKRTKCIETYPTTQPFTIIQLNTYWTNPPVKHHYLTSNRTLIESLTRKATIQINLTHRPLSNHSTKATIHDWWFHHCLQRIPPDNRPQLNVLINTHQIIPIATQPPIS